MTDDPFTEEVDPEDWLNALEDRAQANSIEKLLDFQYHEVDWVEPGQIYQDEAGELQIESIPTKEHLPFILFNNERLYVFDDSPWGIDALEHYKLKYVHKNAIKTLFTKVVWIDFERFALIQPEFWVDFRDHFLTQHCPPWEDAEPAFVAMKIWQEKEALAALAAKPTTARQQTTFKL